MIKFYRYEDTLGSHAISEDEIIAEYYPYWSSLMVKAGRRPNIEDCLDDWIMIHWAWQIPADEAATLMKGKCECSTIKK